MGEEKPLNRRYQEHYDTYHWKGSSDLAISRWPFSIKVIQIAHGHSHTAFLTEHGKVFCCGKNTHGQLGIGQDQPMTYEPVEVASLAGRTVTSVAVGLRHTICGTLSGEVFCWGDSTHAQCGPEGSLHWTPNLIKTFHVSIVKVSCCSTASVCLLSDGRIYAWGTAPILRDLHSLNQRWPEPQMFSYLEDRKALDVACGSNFIVVVLKREVASRTIASKNNYVVVHLGKQQSQSSSINVNSDVNNAESRAEDQSGNTCPLGLEVSEEHVYLSTSQSGTPLGSPLNIRKLPSRSSTSSMSSSKQITPSECSESDISTRPESFETDFPVVLPSGKSESTFHLDPTHVEQWFKEHVGAGFISPTSNNSKQKEELTPTPITSTEAGPDGASAVAMLNASAAVPHAGKVIVENKIGTLSIDMDRLSTGSGDSRNEVFGLTPFISSMESSFCEPRSISATKRHSSPSVVAHSRIKQLSSNSLHTSVKQASPGYVLRACTSADVWSWGDGESGQLGHGDLLERLQPCLITALTNKQVCQVTCGEHHCLALTTDGQVYGWGNNSQGQIIHHEKVAVLEPKQVKISKKIPVVRVSAGSEHSLLSVLSPTNSPFKSGVFLYGKSNDNELGKRLDFMQRLGSQTHCVTAGPNLLCAACVKVEQSGSEKEFRTLLAEELDFYRLLLEILPVLVEPIIDSDIMANLQKSAYGETIRLLFEALFRLVDKIGLNTQEMLTLRDVSCLNQISVVGNTEEYLQHFHEYSVYFHDLLAMNGFSYLTDVVRSIILSLESDIDNLFERCFSASGESGDLDLAAKFIRLLQFPLRRVNEYHEQLERIQLHLREELSSLDNLLHAALINLASQRKALTDHYESAESTRLFWGSKKVLEPLIEPKRRLIKDSKSLPLHLSGASRLTQHWFVLFNDLFVHIKDSLRKIYPLEKVWLEMVAESETNTKQEFKFKLIMPEASYTLQAANTAEKTEWILFLNQAISHRLVPYKNGDSARGTSFTRPSIIRKASHEFCLAGPLRGTVYKGQWRIGLMHGKGALTWPDGRVYVGCFSDGQMTGHGELTARLEGGLESKKGNWKNGKLHGFACTKSANGDSYVGFFKDNMKHGHGTFEQRVTGAVYVGEWKDDLRHGYGVSDCDGEKYLGMWVNDCMSGAGVKVTLDGCYMEGNFHNSTLIGEGLLMTGDNTYYQGTFSAGSEVSCKGLMCLDNGDSIKGTFEGSWIDGIKVTGIYQKKKFIDEAVADCRWSGRDSNVPSTFGKLGVSCDLKWTQLFCHARIALGIVDGQAVCCDTAWSKVAVVLANLQKSPNKKLRHIENLENIPPHNVGHLSLKHYHVIRSYIRKAVDCEFHQLGLLLKNLVDVFRTSYAGTGTHPRLLVHAKQEVFSLAHRFYETVRLLFPELPAAADLDQFRNDFLNFTDDTDGEIIEIFSPTLLVYPLFLPRVYEPLYHLYALHNQSVDEQYWKRIQRFTKQSDFGLLANVGVDEKFCFLSSSTTVCETSLDGAISRSVVCYKEPIETLQRLSTAMTPAEKLNILKQTFATLNEVLKNNVPRDFLWGMDDLFPIFLFVVIRSRLRYLATEIHFMEDLLDPYLEHGEIRYMFTTFQACLHQILTEKVI